MNSKRPTKNEQALQRKSNSYMQTTGHGQSRQVSRHHSEPFNPFGDPFANCLINPLDTFPSPFGGSMLDNFFSGSMQNDFMSFSNQMMNGTGQGCHYSSVMVMNSTVGPDGKNHVEKYARSCASNTASQIHELKEAYTNSSLGLDKYAHDRKIGDRGRRLTKERNRNTQEVIVNDEFYGMERTEDRVQQLEDEWASRARGALGAGAQIPGVDNAPAYLASSSNSTTRRPRQSRYLPH